MATMNGNEHNYDPSQCKSCDGGVDCKRVSQPKLSLCKKCKCFTCDKGKCKSY